MLRVLAAVPYPVNRVGGQRYRLEQWAPLLRAEDIEITFSSFLTERTMDVLYDPGHEWAKIASTIRGHVKRLLELPGLGKYDVVFVYREAALLGPAWFEALAARRVPVVFDFDDAIYLPAASSANAWVRILKPAGKAATLCRLARHVTVGSEHLAAFARPLGCPTTVVPSTIDTETYRIAARTPNAKPVIGWTGSPTTVTYLRGIAGALRRLRSEVDYDLRVIGAPFSLEGVQVNPVPWRAATEVDDLRPLDVGLMPLPDDEWSRGKCGMKALQYMALGIPAVVSPVGANATIVHDGVNGLHARTEDEWLDRIVRLLRDEELRHRLGAEARRTVEESFSARVQAPRLAHVLREAAS